MHNFDWDVSETRRPVDLSGNSVDPRISRKQFLLERKREREERQLRRERQIAATQIQKTLRACVSIEKERILIAREMERELYELLRAGEITSRQLSNLTRRITIVANCQRVKLVETYLKVLRLDLIASVTYFASDTYFLPFFRNTDCRHEVFQIRHLGMRLLRQRIDNDVILEFLEILVQLPQSHFESFVEYLVPHGLLDVLNENWRQDSRHRIILRRLIQDGKVCQKFRLDTLHYLFCVDDCEDLEIWTSLRGTGLQKPVTPTELLNVLRNVFRLARERIYLRQSFSDLLELGLSVFNCELQETCYVKTRLRDSPELVDTQLFLKLLENCDSARDCQLTLHLLNQICLNKDSYEQLVVSLAFTNLHSSLLDVVLDACVQNSIKKQDLIESCNLERMPPLVQQCFSQFFARLAANEPDVVSSLAFFANLYLKRLQSMSDDEFLKKNPIQFPEKVRFVSYLFNNSGFRLIALQTKFCLEEQQRDCLSRMSECLQLLHAADSRLRFWDSPKFWEIPESVLYTLEKCDLFEKRDDDESEFSNDFSHRDYCTDREVAREIVTSMSHVVPFADRVHIFHLQVESEQDRDRNEVPFLWYDEVTHKIRRKLIVEDGLSLFRRLTQDQLKGVIRIAFVSSLEQYRVEEGIDGGGLFKEFLCLLVRQVFSTDFGFFSSTQHDRTLFPHPAADVLLGTSAGDSEQIFFLLGKIVGKALYDRILLEPKFSPVFLSLVLNKPTKFDDLVFIDPVLHRNLNFLKNTENVREVEDMCLTFSVKKSDFDGGVHDLIPNGREISVTPENRMLYIQKSADYMCRTQIDWQTRAFTRGLGFCVSLDWLRMFSAHELSNLISGTDEVLDIHDLRQNMCYVGGGYTENSKTILDFWEVLHNMSQDERAQFLMFVTGCSRPPHLGFEHLSPKFSICRVSNADYLPSASTCANLLKLPDYQDREALKMKLLQAIMNTEGFELS